LRLIVYLCIELKIAYNGSWQLAIGGGKVKVIPPPTAQNTSSSCSNKLGPKGAVGGDCPALMPTLINLTVKSDDSTFNRQKIQNKPLKNEKHI